MMVRSFHGSSDGSMETFTSGTNRFVRSHGKVSKDRYENTHKNKMTSRLRISNPPATNEGSSIIRDSDLLQHPHQNDHWSTFRVSYRVDERSLGERSCRDGTVSLTHCGDNKREPEPHHLRWSCQDFEFSHELGKGHFGQVVLAKQKVDGNKFAVKRLSKRKILHEGGGGGGGGGATIRMLKREIEIHSQ